MESLHQIEQAVTQLSKEELARFREWFEEFEAQALDEQFEEDIASGKLDRFAEQAIADFHAGKCREL
jgi:hypothetical protein